MEAGICARFPPCFSNANADSISSAITLEKIMSESYVVVTMRFHRMTKPVKVEGVTDPASQIFADALAAWTTVPEFEQETRSDLSFRGPNDVKALVAEYRAKEKWIINLIPLGVPLQTKSDRLHVAFFAIHVDETKILFTWSGCHGTEPFAPATFEILRSQASAGSKGNLIPLGVATIPLSS
jgi:hypothetical protein